jgi:hypothetical protein
MQKKQQKAIEVPGHQVLAEPVHLGQARDNMAVVLAVLTASFGVTGYSLPWDPFGYGAVQIVTGVPEAIPLKGSPFFSGVITWKC